MVHRENTTCKVATFLGNINESMQKTLNAKDREIFDDKNNLALEVNKTFLTYK